MKEKSSTSRMKAESRERCQIRFERTHSKPGRLGLEMECGLAGHFCPDARSLPGEVKSLKGNLPHGNDDGNDGRGMMEG